MNNFISTLLFLMLFFSNEASAKRVPVTILFGSGTDIIHIKDLDEIVDIETPLKIGYSYEYSHLFLLNLSTSQGQFCIYANEKKWLPISDDEAALYLGVTEVTPPIRYRIPTFWLSILMIVAFPFALAIAFGLQHLFKKYVNV